MVTAIHSTPDADDNAFSRFVREKRGSVAIMTGIMFPVMLMLAGGATDITRAETMRAKAQKTLDAAVLSMANSNLTDEEIETEGTEMLENWFALRNMKGALKDVELTSGKNGSADGKPGELKVQATLTTKTYFLSLFGTDVLDLGISSATLKPNPLPYEISLVLDVSGSMNEDLNGSTRLQRLREATVALLDEVESQSKEREATTVSIVPYSTSVNLGGLGTGILEGSSVGGKTPSGGDVWAAERFRSDGGTGFDLADDSPATSAVPFVTAGEIQNTGPTVRITPPTNDPATYRAAVQKLEAGGWTAAHLGMVWGVYALSPAWSSVWGSAPRDRGEAQKVIVLLTDGEFNTTHNIGARSNSDGESSNTYFQSACDLAKEKGIAIYTVALGLDTVSEQRLRSCSTGSGGKMFSADSAASLTDAFKKIASDLGKLRISS